MKIETIDRIDLRTLLCFERVAVLGSFSSASRQLNMPRALVSRLIQRLEEQLGTLLFQRTTRKVSLTQEGQKLLETALPSFLILRNALLEGTTTTINYRGTVSFSVSQSFGRRFVLPALPQFIEMFPNIEIDMSAADNLDDLVAEGLDFAIRIGDLPDSSVVARKLADIDVILAVPSSIREDHKLPLAINDLDALPQIGFRIPGTQQLYRWHFEKDGDVQTKMPTDRCLTTDSIEDVAQLVISGIGIAPLPRYLVKEHLDSGTLSIGLPDYKLPSIPLQICFPSRGTRPARVEALSDYLSKYIQAALN